MMPYDLLIGASLIGGLPSLQRPKYRWGYLLVMGAACWLLASLRYVIGFAYPGRATAFSTF